MDWGSWPRNGPPDCPANLNTPCRLFHTAVDSASVASMRSAHCNMRRPAVIREPGDFASKRVVKLWLPNLRSSFRPTSNRCTHASLGLHLTAPPISPSLLETLFRCKIGRGRRSRKTRGASPRTWDNLTRNSMGQTAEARALTCSCSSITRMLHSQTVYTTCKSTW
jgi:hypothetical protein